MIKDPIIEEIHKYREEHAVKFNFDIRKIVEHYKQQQQNNNRKTKNFTTQTDEIMAQE